jgi:hypothetical protein
VTRLFPFAADANHAVVAGPVELPLGDRLFGADHSRKHDTDGKDQFNVPPDDVHVVALDLIFGNFPHENRHSLTHATRSIDSVFGRSIRVARTLPKDEHLTKVSLARSIFPRRSERSRLVAPSTSAPSLAIDAAA